MRALVRQEGADETDREAGARGLGKPGRVKQVVDSPRDMVPVVGPKTLAGVEIDRRPAGTHDRSGRVEAGKPPGETLSTDCNATVAHAGDAALRVRAR